MGPPPKVVRDIKLGAGARPDPEPHSGDFELKTHLVEFFQEIERIGNGKVSKIELRFGLPVHMTVEETAGKSFDHCGAGDDGV